ncbi:pseudaminic acid synthase [Candidatus Magnetobacterium casense]|uniref:Pseudaminic acid synthase n=1 Tax=Candidatus Magnetobacterium casense TaxID=1455061 RepID=A0ABS6S3R7_9BACT|nr:pseudaminic acid synthase [Candidatus Magnetobacterium casensis]MBV6343504.1 pseudaminic acid synthase [Candidatus Magnetobacterium casensis]
MPGGSLSDTLTIQGRKIGAGEPVFIVAEVSANHRQSLDVALRTIEAAKEAGADAVKFQTYTPDTITIDSQQEHFRIRHGTIWDGKTLYQLYEEAFTPWQWYGQLRARAQDVGLVSFSSPFDKTAVDFLEEMQTPAYKVASFEITDIPLIRYMASKGRPVIISTGIAEPSDIEEAIDTCKGVGNQDIALLKCSSIYPTPFEEVNLRGITWLRERFGVIVGLSDHSPSIAIPVASVVLGACIVEKHFTLGRHLGGPDSGFSLEPHEFKQMALAIRQIEAALGDGSYRTSDKVRRNRIHARSLFVVADIQAGQPFTEDNVRSIRPGNGLHPRHLKDVLGKPATTFIARGTPLSWQLVEGGGDGSC